MDKQEEKFALYNQIKLAIFITITAILIMWFRTNVISMNYVPTKSMENTLCVGDILLGSCNTDNINRYDIIVFYPPKEAKPEYKSEKYVKRVIGLPGDTVSIKDNKVYINGKLIEEDYIKEPMETADATYEIPKDEYFVMGDNRNNSLDARFWNGAFVKKDSILSVETTIIYPFNRVGSCVYN